MGCSACESTKVGNKKNITGSLVCRSVKTLHQEFIQQIQKMQSLKVINSTFTQTSFIEVLYSVIDETEPFEAAHNSPLVRALTLSVLDVEKKRPMLIRKTGTGDMNVIGNQLKIPVITYGPGDPHEAHTIDEKVSIDEFVKGIEILKKSLHHLKRLHDRTK